MSITVTIKTVYGNDLIYPACEKSRLFAELAGSKTLTPAALKKIEALGYSVVRA